jgi:hypothetical protein
MSPAGSSTWRSSRRSTSAVRTGSEDRGVGLRHQCRVFHCGDAVVLVYQP